MQPIHFFKLLVKQHFVLVKELTINLLMSFIANMWAGIRRHLLATYEQTDCLKREGALLGKICDVLHPNDILGACVAVAVEL